MRQIIHDRDMRTPLGCRDPPVGVSRSDVSHHEFGRAQTMFKNARIHLRRQLVVGGSLTALAMACLGGAGAFAADPDKAIDRIHTATPIKHVLIIVGENRGFDHLYATYVPKNRDERVLNLLSERIINADGSPGKNFAKAHQYQVTSAPNGGKYFVSVDLKNKSLYGVLPAPDTNGVQNPSFA